MKISLDINDLQLLVIQYYQNWKEAFGYNFFSKPQKNLFHKPKPALKKHSENLSNWNGEKSLKRFWIHFPYLLNEKITKISRKMKSQDGF